jgi:hypothetical protein
MCRLLGTEVVKLAKSAIESPNNLFSTFFDHGLGYPSNVREDEQRRINGSFFGSRQKLGKSTS